MAVINRLRLCVLLLKSAWLPLSQAAVLAEDRADAMYHRYEGGGITVDGPSILVRKKVSEDVSLSANYYVDTISSASIDVLATASEYTEERTEYSAGVDYLHDKTIMSLNYTMSDENDFEAKSMHFSLSQDFFGDLTTLTLGYSKGWDEITMTGNESFFEEADRQNYRLSVSQVLTKNFIMGLNLEKITDEGFLNNPYRSVRYLDANSATGYSYESEVYPNTRTSDAGTLQAKYFLPYRAVIYGNYRYFTDTWGIDAHTGQVGYTHTLGENWLIDVRYRYYTQTSADFYSDLFERAGQFNFRARDKEMSEFSDQTFGITLTWGKQFAPDNFVTKSSINLSYEYIDFDYDNFRNVLVDSPVGEEPLYSFSADVIRFYVSFWI